MTVNFRDAELQLRIIRVTVRAEAGRAPSPAFNAVQARAFRILDAMEESASDSLRQKIAAVRHEIS